MNDPKLTLTSISGPKKAGKSCSGPILPAPVTALKPGFYAFPPAPPELAKPIMRPPTTR